MTGYIHSRESFGTVDGPGIRYVVFMQGCPMRCKYCHNPDTWEMNVGEKVESEEIIADYLKNSSFYQNGGITVTGGEPLMQTEFVAELFTLAKEHDIHTCIDTSGVTYLPDNEDYLKKLDKLLLVTDLVMLDIKHIDNNAHIELTGKENTNILAFAKYLSDKNIPVWIRHVVVPGISDSADDHIKLGEFIATLTNVKALDVLPYHTMGVSKYKELGLPYALEGVESLSRLDAVKAKENIIQGIKKVRNM